ncbi:hypothetical protein GF352_02050 [archaeon]|nr:hypothetical protein [archaeon]
MNQLINPSMTASVEAANPPVKKEGEKEEDYVMKINPEEIIRLYNQGEVTELQGIYAIRRFLEFFHDSRQPEMTGRRKMDIQLNNPEEVARFFKAIGEKEGIKEISDYADIYYDGVRTGQIIDFGFGLLEKHGLLEKYAKASKHHVLAAQLSLGRGGEQLSPEEKELYGEAFIARDYYQNLPFPNSNNFSASQAALSSLMYADSDTKKKFSGLERVIQGKDVKAARKDVYDIPVSKQYAPRVQMQ